MKTNGMKKWMTLGLLLLMALGLWSQGFGDSTEALKQLPESKVAIVQSAKEEARDIDEEEVKFMVREAVKLAGGFKGLIKDNMTVVIKPNLVNDCDYTRWPNPKLPKQANGVTTDWRITKAVVALVREYNPHGKVYVMEGSARPTKEVMKNLCYTPEYIPGVDEFLAIEEDSGAWQDFHSPGLARVSLPNGLIHQEYYLNRKYKEADVVISLPCLKNHWSATVTGAIKNVGIGATPANIYGESETSVGRGAMVNHDTPAGDLHKWIHDFYLCRPVDFVIMDGLQGIQNGPTPSSDPNLSGTGGTTFIAQDWKNMRLILAGRDAVAVDTIESLVMNWDPQSVRYLQFLNASAAGNLDTACIKVVGKPVDQVRKDFAGRIPPAGGSKVMDKTPPGLKIRKQQMKNETLFLSLTVGKDTRKVEIYVDDRFHSVYTDNCAEIRADFSALDAGKHQITVWAYDRFLNRSEKKFAINLKKTISDGHYIAPRASSPPVIDGYGTEKAWSDAPWRAIKYIWLGPRLEPDDFNGRYKVLWTPEKLYFLVEVTDDRLIDNHNDPLDHYPDDDCLEIFLDEDHSGGDHTANYNAWAYHLAIDYNVVDMDRTGRPRLFNDHIQAKRTQNGTTYTWELAIKVYGSNYDEKSSDNQTVPLLPKKKLGFLVAYCDNDYSQNRESFIGSIQIPGADKNVAWRTADVFGTLELLK